MDGADNPVPFATVQSQEAKFILGLQRLILEWPPLILSMDHLAGGMVMQMKSHGESDVVKVRLNRVYRQEGSVLHKTLSLRPPKATRIGGTHSRRAKPCEPVIDRLHLHHRGSSACVANGTRLVVRSGGFARILQPDRIEASPIKSRRCCGHPGCENVFISAFSFTWNNEVPSRQRRGGG